MKQEAQDSILWRRVDTPGHDACRLDRTQDGWQLSGAAVFRDGDLPVCVSYRVLSDEAWATQEGRVRGWAGAHSIDFDVRRMADGVWTLNGRPDANLFGCSDLDLGFTPASNLFQLRRVALEVGQAADVPVAWMDVSSGSLELLQQRYERRGLDTYWYEAPRFDYAALLRVGKTGFIEDYPGLWAAAA